MTLPPTTVTRAAADIGGTFTDIAVLAPDGRIVTRKVPSTPDNYARAVVRGVTELLAALGAPPHAVQEVLHGCTVATNAFFFNNTATTERAPTMRINDRRSFIGRLS